MKNRFGCTYFRLQKYIELDIREKHHQHGWPKQAPYDIERYRSHYFWNDFEDLKVRFKENNAAFDHNTMIDDHGRKVYSEFVPYKTAVRLIDSIKFSLYVDTRSPRLRSTTETENFLEQYDKKRADAIAARLKVKPLDGEKTFKEEFKQLDDDIYEANRENQLKKSRELEKKRNAVVDQFYGRLASHGVGEPSS